MTPLIGGAKNRNTPTQNFLDFSVLTQIAVSKSLAARKSVTNS